MMKSRLYFFNIILLTLFLVGSGCNQQREKKAEMTEEHYSMEDFKRVPKIDTHAHINTDGKTMINVARENNFKLMVMAVDVVPD